MSDLHVSASDASALPPSNGSAISDAPKSKNGKPYLDPVTKKFAKGNPGGGRPPGVSTFEAEFRRFLREVEHEEKLPFFKHYFRRAYKKDNVLLHAVDKFIPAAKSVEPADLPDLTLNVVQQVVQTESLTLKPHA